MAKTAINRAGWSDYRSVVECDVSGGIGERAHYHRSYLR